MAKITKEEVLKIAKMSHLELHEDEIPALLKQLEDVLGYAARVKDVSGVSQEAPVRNINVMRDDVAQPSNPEILLAQAPEREGSYFVVPAILDHAE
jgi:aspartyl-tRNA(Asn)/glutamyl-tRNA(Gln) amidotransferase subunit C